MGRLASVPRSHARRRRESTARSLAVVICREIDWREHGGICEANTKVIMYVIIYTNAHYNDIFFDLFFEAGS